VGLDKRQPEERPVWGDTIAVETSSLERGGTVDPHARHRRFADYPVAHSTVELTSEDLSHQVLHKAKHAQLNIGRESMLEIIRARFDQRLSPSDAIIGALFSVSRNPFLELQRA
jgi:hypothetical protein